jgi:hypothetical protein
VIVQLEDCGFSILGSEQSAYGKSFFVEMCLDGVGEGDAVEVVFAFWAAFEEELASFGYYDHFWGAFVPCGQWCELSNVADVVMAQCLCQFC